MALFAVARSTDPFNFSIYFGPLKGAEEAEMTSTLQKQLQEKVVAPQALQPLKAAMKQATRSDSLDELKKLAEEYNVSPKGHAGKKESWRKPLADEINRQMEVATKAPTPAKPAEVSKQAGNLDPDTGLPQVDPDALRENDTWVKEAGEQFFKNEDFLRVTEAHEQDYLESRAKARKNVKALRAEAKRRGVDWRRVQDNALIPQINAVPVPDTKNVHRARKEMAEVLCILTERPNHRRTPDGNPEISLYRYAGREDMADIRSFQQSRNKKTHKMVGSWEVGNGRWIIPNRDPVTKTHTRFQRAVGYAIGRKLKEFTRADRELARAEVEQARAENARTELTELAREMPGVYTCPNKSGTGAVIVRGDYKTVKGDDGEEEIFHVTTEDAVGALEHLRNHRGFCTRLAMIMPSERLNKGPAISRKHREKGKEHEREVRLIANTIYNAIARAVREQENENGSVDEQIAKEMSKPDIGPTQEDLEQMEGSTSS